MSSGLIHTKNGHGMLWRGLRARCFYSANRSWTVIWMAIPQVSQVDFPVNIDLKVDFTILFGDGGFTNINFSGFLLILGLVALVTCLSHVGRIGLVLKQLSTKTRSLLVRASGFYQRSDLRASIWENGGPSRVNSRLLDSGETLERSKG